MLSLSFTPFPKLTTQRLVLRRIDQSDANELFSMRSDPRVMQHIARPLAKTIDDATNLITQITELENTNEAINWAITLKPDNKLIGTFCFWNIQKENNRAEIGYMLHHNHQGNGIMQETLATTLDYGFNRMNLHSVEAHVDPDNVASIKLLERKGFLREGYFKENWFFNGKYLDTIVYSLLAPSKV